MEKYKLGWKKISWKQSFKKAEIAILISEKVDFKAKKITSNKETHYIMIKDEFTQKIWWS